MSNIYSLFGYAMAANVEAAVLLYAAWWSGGWLNQHYPRSFSWMPITFLIALIVIVHTFYMVFRTAYRQDRARQVANQPRRR